jgi:hypothetical protein
VHALLHLQLMPEQHLLPLVHQPLLHRLLL